MPNQRKDQVSEKKFYDNFWQTQVSLSCDEKCRLRFILSEVRRLRAHSLQGHAKKTDRGAADAAGSSGFRIADVGCGRGWLTQLLSRFGEVTGFDRSTTEANKRYAGSRFLECNVLELPPDDFDLVVCSEVIEHVRKEEQPKLIESLFAALRPGGMLIMTTPNKPNVSQLVSELSLERELQPIEDWLDVRTLEELVSRRFEIKKVRTIMFFPIPVRKIGPLSRVYRTLYEQFGGYRVLDPLLQRTTRGLYIGLVAKRKDSDE